MQYISISHALYTITDSLIARLMKQERQEERNDTTNTNENKETKKSKRDATTDRIEKGKVGHQKIVTAKVKRFFSMFSYCGERC